MKYISTNNMELMEYIDSNEDLAASIYKAITESVGELNPRYHAFSANGWDSQVKQPLSNMFTNEEFVRIINESVGLRHDDTKEHPEIQTQISEEHRSQDSLKAAQKKKNKIKFIVGQQYALRSKSKDGSRSEEKVFELKKFIYTINDLPVNVVVMKQLSGEQSRIFTLNKHDCLLYHIKYEPGLQVWPMSMKWVKVKQKETNNK